MSSITVLKVILRNDIHAMISGQSDKMAIVKTVYGFPRNICSFRLLSVRFAIRSHGSVNEIENANALSSFHCFGNSSKKQETLNLNGFSVMESSSKHDCVIPKGHDLSKISFSPTRGNAEKLLSRFTRVITNGIISEIRSYSKCA